MDNGQRRDRHAAQGLLLALFWLCTTSLLMWGCEDGQCPGACELGRTFCSAQGITSCAMNPATQCPQWQLRLCPNEQNCVTGASGLPQCQSKATCTNPYHSKKCVGQVLFWYDDCGRQREVALTCPEGTICQGDACKADGTGGPCQSECGPGQSRCTDAGWLSTCLRGNDNCYRWGQPSQCPSGQQCRGGTCQQGPCHDLCPINATRCQGTGIQNCQKGSNGCTAWGAVYQCQPGQICQQNQCVQAKCPGQCKITADCALPDCGKRTACENNRCVEPSAQCKDKCVLGKTRCQGVELQACRREAHGCTDWGPPVKCLTGQQCQGGACVPIPCPQSCTQDRQCAVAACGNRLKCIGGVCSAPQQPQCPSSCTQASQCAIPACGSRTSCTNGACATPQQPQCPSSCAQDSQCAIPACGTRTKCTNGACAVPQQPQCPASCSQDSQCAIPACGANNTCVQGKCGPPPSSGGWKYGNNVKFIQHTKQNSKSNPDWGSLLTDIMNHQPNGQQQLQFTNPVILGHETNHFIQNHFRNKFTLADGRKVNAFYVFQGRIIKLNEPNFNLADIAQYVPTPLQHSRYKHYLIDQQKHWNDRPLYLMDEWACYTVDAAIAVELSKTGKWKYGSADDVKGPLEFLVYGLALAMATEKKDPTYFKNNTQFLEVVAWMGARGMKAHREGLTFTNFQGFNQAQYIKDLQTHPDAKVMRDFAVRVFGQKWVDNVIFGKP